VQQGGFVAVVAQTEWAAVQAATALKVTWSTPATKMPRNIDEVHAYLRNTKPYSTQTPINTGDVDTALARATKTFEGAFGWPFNLHGMLGPSCAVADVQGDKATVWSGSQGPFNARKAVAAALAVPETNVRIIYREGSGCYGRLEDDDVTLDAALMSRAVGKPVRVQWSRQDEHGWEPKGPAQFVSVRAGIDAQGKIVAWDFRDHSFPWTEALPNPWLAGRQIGLKANAHGFLNGSGASGEIYKFDNQRIAAASIPWIFDDPIPLRTSNLRAPGELARCFASECLMDEIASFVKADPVQFRLQYLAHDPRFTEVLQAAAKQAAWKERPSPATAAAGTKAAGRGVALVNRSNSYVAAIAEVEVDKASGKVSVHKVTIAHDCGFIVNPDGVKNQIEGNVIQGVSRALLEEVLFDENGIKNLDWRSYPVITFKQVPDVDIVLLHRPDAQPLGAGESSIGPIPAAIANAIFDATGARLRQAPFTAARVLAAIQAQQKA
jgi:CO/xanthine dehydrogenase Mo-binding subunit